MDLLTITNYTELPEGVDVKIYPKDHIISGKTFKIVVENNRDEGLYWGAYWEAEKWVNGHWIYQKPPWGTWVDPLLYTDPNSVLIYDERAFFGPGVYRITKNFMLTDVYLRDEERWESEFTVQFVVVKTS